MLHISGGAYFELCIEPHWFQLFGSGGRAASTLSGLSDRVVLSTFVSDYSAPTLSVLATTFGFEVESSIVQHTPHFTYAHALSEPSIWPAKCSLDQTSSLLQVEAENILRFGFLEGDAVVIGNRVVYDPQSPGNPRRFGDNGSVAEHLAIVANEREMLALLGNRAIAQLGPELLQELEAEVVVVKRGAFGALLITKDTAATIPAYRTDLVWPIGSGDVFSSVFSHYWAELSEDPLTAAQHASLATAFYCATRTLPIPRDPLAFPGFSASPVTLSDDESVRSVPQVYLAGPLFTMAERWLINETKHALESIGMTVFSPLHDVGRGEADEVAPADIVGLETSRAVLALADGLDAGTIFETGYATARGIPVIAFAQNESPGNLTMLEGSGCQVFDDFASAVYHTGWAALAG